MNLGQIYLIVLFFWTTYSYGCPLQVYASRSLHDLIDKPVDGLSLYSSVDGKAWKKQDLQTDNGGLSEKTPKTIQLHTRLTMESKSFGLPRDSRLQALLKCGTKTSHYIYEVQELHSNRFSYLNYCELEDSVGSVQNDQFSYEKASLLFQTPGIRFKHKPWNFYLFESASVFNQKLQKWLEISKDASFNLHLNVKKFFNINLDDKRVVADLKFLQKGELSLSSRLKFFLKVFFFKMNLSANSFASFYKDGVHLPISFNVPLNASSRLNKGSGFLFSWRNTGMKFTNIGRGMPVWSYDRFKDHFESLKKEALTFCDSTSCKFSLKSAVGDQPYTMTMLQSRAAAEQGFFPMWVEDSSAFNSAMSTGVNSSNLQGKVAIYQESSSLRKGEQRLDLWIHRDESIDGRYHACPASFKIRRL